MRDFRRGGAFEAVYSVLGVPVPGVPGVNCVANRILLSENELNLSPERAELAPPQMVPRAFHTTGGTLMPTKLVRLAARASVRAVRAASRWARVGALVAAGFGLVACQSENELPSAEILADDGPIEYVYASEGDSLLPRVRFADGQVSVNDRCPVRQVKLNRRMPPLYVNGHPVGFC